MLNKQIGILAGFGLMMLAFQNCGSKDYGSAPTGDSALFNAAGKKDIQDNKESLTQVSQPIGGGSVVGNFNVISITRNLCASGACSSQVQAFKSKQTLSFLANGKLSGKAACNTFGGAYKATLRKNEGTHLLAIDLGAATRMGCDLISEEQALFNALPLAYKIDNTSGHNVNVYAHDKAPGATYTIRLQRSIVTDTPKPPVTARAVLSGKYRVVSWSKNLCPTYNNGLSGPCVIESIKFKSQQTINFAAKGVVSGTAACNQFGGSYKYTQRAKEGTDLVKITNLVSTQRACSELKEEQRLFKALEDAYKVQFSKSGNVQNVHLHLEGGATLLLQK